MLTIENSKLTTCINFLNSLKLKGKASRGRSKLIELLDKKNEELQQDVRSIQKEHFQKDENGNLKADKNGTLVAKSDSEVEQAQKEMDELYSEKAKINIDEYQEKIDALYQALDNYEYELSDVDALVYNEIMEALENSKLEEN